MRLPRRGLVVVTAALTVVTLATALGGPGPSSRRLALGDVPKISVPIRVNASAEARPAPHGAPAARIRPAHATKAAVAPAQPKKAASSGHLVREVHVMYARDARTSDVPNSSPCPRATTCARYQLRPPRWPTTPDGRAIIPIAYSDEGRRRARAADGLMEPALQAAMAEWRHWNSNVVLQAAGNTTATFGATGADGSCDDGTNVVTWTRLDPGVIGEAMLCYDMQGKVIRDADLALNAAQHWERISGTPESRHSYDIQSILTHELGHWIGLEDLYSADTSRQTMHGETEYGDVRKRTPALGDIVGVQTAYPCGAQDSCPRSGIADD